MLLSSLAAFGIRFRDRLLGWLAIKQFGRFGVGCRGAGWFSVSGGEGIHVSDNVVVGKSACFVCRGGQVVVGASTSIRHNAEIRAVTGEIKFGRGVVVAAYTIIKSGARNVDIADRVWIARNCIIEGDVSIDPDTMLGPYVHIVAADHGFAETDRPINQQGAIAEPIEIGADCWLGSGTVVTKGVTIGEGSVIGSRSVVIRDVPPYSVAVGVPAEVIRQRG